MLQALRSRQFLAVISLTAAISGRAFGDDPWVVYEGGDGPGHGKHIVLISGDEEYRSEEALPQLGKILARHHGFRCTALFAIDAETGTINPNVRDNIPGLEALAAADLMIIFTRFRALPEKQMQKIDDYLKSGRPVIGIRTATHAFRFDKKDKWAHYGNGYGGDRNAWTDGFGRLVLGEKWISHHGHHRYQSTRGIIAPGAGGHPITRGIKDGDIWAPTDVYGVRLPLPGDSKPIVLGQVINSKGEYDEEDPFYGLRPTDSEPAVVNPRRKESGNPNDPMMPVAWTKTYQLPGGEPGSVFTSTVGASTDLVSEGVRRMFVNAVYWCMRMEDSIPVSGTKVDLVGSYAPTGYRSHPDDYWSDRNMTVSDHQLD